MNEQDKAMLRDVLMLGLIVFVIWYLFRSGTLHIAALSNMAGGGAGGAGGAGGFGPGTGVGPGTTSATANQCCGGNPTTGGVAAPNPAQVDSGLPQISPGTPPLTDDGSGTLFGGFYAIGNFPQTGPGATID